MIGKLTGIVSDIADGEIIVDVNGVGYVVACDSLTLHNIGKIGDQVSLRITTQVRQDAINLIGFLTELDQRWFELLLTVQGVGNKVALGILGAIGGQNLQQVFYRGEKAAFERISGIGPRLAGRLLTELKDKLPKLAWLGVMTVPAASATAAPTNLNAEVDAALELEDLHNNLHNVVSALINLGYKRAQIMPVLDDVDKDQPFQDLFKQVLSRLANYRQ